MADRLANQPGCNTCGCDDCPAITSCFALIVCASYVPDEAMTITGTDLAKVPTGESASGATGAAGEPFCITWAARPALSLVEFTWKDCHLAAYLPTALCSYSFDFDVCIARGVVWDAYNILDDTVVDDVQICCDGLRSGAIPWADHLGTCVPSSTTRELYWWNIPPSYAAAGLDCDWEYTGVPPSTLAGVRCSTTGFIDGSSPSEYAPYIWECTHNYAWCCEDDATFRMGGLPVDDPDGLWSFYPCHSGAFLLTPPGTGVYGAWGCPDCRAAADMTYANMNSWAKNVHYEFSFTYYYPSGVYGASPLSSSVSMSGTLPFDCPPYSLDSGAPAWDSGAITVSWPAGIYYFAGADPSDWHPYNVTSIRILFWATLPTGYGRFEILALANDIPPGGFSFAGCDRAPHSPIGWDFVPDDLDNIFVQMTEGAPYGQCDHHIDWTGTATEPYSPVTCRLYGTVSVTGPV